MFDYHHCLRRTAALLISVGKLNLRSLGHRCTPIDGESADNSRMWSSSVPGQWGKLGDLGTVWGETYIRRTVSEVYLDLRVLAVNPLSDVISGSHKPKGFENVPNFSIEIGIHKNDSETLNDVQTRILLSRSHILTTTMHNSTLTFQNCWSLPKIIFLGFSVRSLRIIILWIEATCLFLHLAIM